MNGTGGVKFYCIKTKAIIERDSWINVPIPDTVIEYLNNMANPTRKRKIIRDPTFDQEDNEEDEHLDEREVIHEPMPNPEVTALGSG
jgi:3-polyprenyl-4-hydroxybenzoate decarboxylase